MQVAVARGRRNGCNYRNPETRPAANQEGKVEQQPTVIGPDRGADNGNYAAYDLNDDDLIWQYRVSTEDIDKVL